MGIIQEVEKIMIDRFGKDSVISLATSKDNMPAVRYVNAQYENNAFYILTYALSNKMKTVFAEWIDNGHNNFEDENTIILKIHLTEGVLFSQGRRYDIEF